MITGDKVILIDTQLGTHVETFKTRFELVMKLINTGCYGDGYGSEAHKTVLAHFEQQIGATREQIAKEETKEAEHERRAEERKKGPQVEFDVWWQELRARGKREGYDIDDPNHSLTESDKNMWRLDYWQAGWTTEDALVHFFDSCG